MELSELSTLIEMLEHRAGTSPGQVAFTFEEQAHTYRSIWAGVRRFGSRLLDADVMPGDRILIVLPNGPDFFTAFYGAQYAGAVPVPMFPGADTGRVNQMAALCRAGIIVADRSQTADELDQPVIRVHMDGIDGKPKQGPAVGPDDVAFIQYTSGSTGDPKGVMLTHRNLMTNIRQMIAGMQIGADDVFVSWLPVYHDMGLILKTMVPFYLGAPLYLMPASLRRVHQWPALIERHKGTFTAAPDIAYRLCIRSVERNAYNLSSLRVALNAAEPVRLKTIRDFEAHFGLEHVMVAGYGLAEATVGVCMWTPGTAPKVDATRHVSVGKPFPEIDIKIVVDDQPVEPGTEGEIMIQSPANTGGYFNNPDATQSLFWNTDFIRSGDLGCLDEEGNLYILGRKKNIMIHAGETLYPADVEELVNTLPGVRYSAAVGIDRGGIEGEQVYIFVEAWGRAGADDEMFQNLIIEIVDRFYRRFGFRPGRVYIVKPRTIPMTPNGKLQHLRLKDLYLSESLNKQQQILYPVFRA